MKIVVGLGNPGNKYTFTRHNIGFLMIDYMAQKYQTKVDRAKFKGLYGEVKIDGEKVILLKPQTFMNVSGESVREITDFYKVAMEDVIVVYDDVSMACGSIRIREKGSAGGHNGIKSIIYHGLTDEFPRIKIGVGSPTHANYDLADWVLGEFNKDEQKIIFDTLGQVTCAVEEMIKGDVKKAMNVYNITVKPKDKEEK